MMMFSKKRNKLAEVLIPAMFVLMTGDVFAAATSAELKQAKTNAKEIVSTQDAAANTAKSEAKKSAATIKQSAIDAANANIAEINAAIKQINTDANTLAKNQKAAIKTGVSTALTTLKNNFNAQKAELKAKLDLNTISKSDYNSGIKTLKAAYNTQVKTVNTGKTEALKAINTLLKEAKQVSAALKASGVSAQKTQKFVGINEANNLLGFQKAAVKSAKIDGKQAGVLLYQTVKVGTATVDEATTTAQDSVVAINDALIAENAALSENKQLYVDTVVGEVDLAAEGAVLAAAASYAALNDNALSAVYALLGSPVLAALPDTPGIIAAVVNESTAILAAVTEAATITEIDTAVSDAQTAAAEEIKTVAETVAVAVEENTAVAKESTAALESAKTALKEAQKDAQNNVPVVVSPSA